MNQGRNIMDTLSKDARVLRYARMLPMDGPLKAEHHDSVRKAYSSYTYKMDISKAAAAKQVGVSASVISQWLNGVYKSDNDKVTHAVNAWVERDARARDVRVELPYVPTRVAEDMRTMARLAYEHQCMAAIVCPAGSGKSKVLEILAEELNGWYIYCDEDLTPRSFLEQLAEIINVPVDRGSAKIKRNVIQKIANTGRPLLIDEAHLLPREVLGRIRSIHDQARVPVIMAGTDEILRRIDDRAGGRGQMHSRCITYNAMEQVMDVDSPTGGSKLGRPLFSKEEIRTLFAHMPVKLTDGAMEMVWAVACLPNHGCLRTIKRVLDLAYRKWADKQLDREELRVVLNLFFGAQGKLVDQLARKHINTCAREVA